MDKDKQRNSIYPEATRGVLANEQIHKQYTKGPSNKVRDYSPSTLIATTMISILLLITLAVGSFIFIFSKTHKLDSTVASVKIAKKVAELKTTQTLDELVANAEQTSKQCYGGKPAVITITHEYSVLGQPSHIDTTVIDTGDIKKIEPVLANIDKKATGARLNTMEIICP